MKGAIQRIFQDHGESYVRENAPERDRSLGARIGKKRKKRPEKKHENDVVESAEKTVAEELSACKGLFQA